MSYPIVTDSIQSSLDHPSPKILAQWRWIEQFVTDPMAYSRRIKQRARNVRNRRERKKRMTP